MRVLVFGHRSILGQAINAYSRMFKTVVYFADASLPIDQELERYKPDAIINCLGTDKNPLDMLYYNATFPHILANITNDIPIYHISTDKVYNGRSNYRYIPQDTPTAQTMFGRTCILGEVEQANVRNIRTSFIIRDRGFAQTVFKEDFTGHENVKWTGSTVEAAARGILYIINHPEYKRTIHLATRESISRYELAKALLCHAGLHDKEMTRTLTPVANFSLHPTVILQSVKEAIKEW